MRAKMIDEYRRKKAEEAKRRREARVLERTTRRVTFLGFQTRDITPERTHEVLLIQRQGAPAMAEAAEELWANLHQAQRADPWTGGIIRFLENGILPEDENAARMIAHTHDQYDITEEGILVRDPVHQVAVCVPEPLRKPVLHALHDTPAAGHLGIKKTVARLRERFYWPRMYSDAVEYVKKCRHCALNKPPPRNHREEQGVREVPTAPWQIVHMDIWAPATRGARKTPKGNAKVLGLVDAFSKFVVLRALPDETTNTIVDTLANDVFPQYGPPERLVSDNGMGFVSKLQGEMLETFGILRKLVIPHHPRANGQVERFFRVLRTMLASIMSALEGTYNDRWDEFLQHLAFAYNTSYHRSLDTTPFYLMTARSPNRDIHNILPPGGVDKSRAEGEDLVEMVSLAREMAHATIQDSARKNKDNADKRSNPQKYDVGDFVYRWVQHPQSKIAPRYEGPYKIVKLADHKATIRSVGRRNPVEFDTHRDNLRHCFEVIDKEMEAIGEGRVARKGVGRPRKDSGVPPAAQAPGPSRSPGTPPPRARRRPGRPRKNQ
jgi:transposase InsO family protein